MLGRIPTNNGGDQQSRRGRNKKLREIWEWRIRGGIKFCDACRKRNKQTQQGCDCEHCPDCCPKPLENNVTFLAFWNKVSRCFHYVGTMDGVYPVSLNWVDVETMARLTRVKLNSKMLKKLSLAEEMTIKESTKKGR